MIELLVMLCPECGQQHVDAGVELHVEHVCKGCGHTWSPREHATFGVELGLLSIAWLGRFAKAHGQAAAAQVRQAWEGRETQRVHEVRMTIARAPTTTWGGRR